MRRRADRDSRRSAAPESPGNEVGLAVGLAVVDQSKVDGYLALPALTPPVDDGFWIPNGAITRLPTFSVKPTETTMTHRPVVAPDLPTPVGPFSPGMQFERLIFVSGQVGTDPTGKLAGPDTATQTAQCLRNVQAILRAAGSDLQFVLRCGVFLVDMKDFAEMNGVYARTFGDNRPARTTVEVSKLPGEGLRVEIDCIAYRP